MKAANRNRHFNWVLTTILIATTSIAWPTRADDGSQNNQASMEQADLTASANSDDDNIEDHFVEGWREGVIETRYLMSESLSAMEIEVVVDGGKATLSGTVSSEIEKQLAQEVALSVSGIEEVDNQLTVSPDEETESAGSIDSEAGHQVNDAMITATIKARYLASPHLNPLDISVTTDKGVVELVGEVASEAERDLAYYIAENTKNVREVNNRVQLNASSS
ncbi:BON domain-containing protein [Hahella ganghwensis]|uniref:BON domain-containing protein n=1 Tax=Hahella ganghwensis TaxID=286420 RepID=UPI000361F583|nr:BON domain-containing protein [Hahella ganghwensis]